MTSARRLIEAMNLDGLSIETSVDFAATNPSHRAELRAAIQRHLTSSTNVDLASLANLESPPRLEGWGISLSHCPALGGFAVAPGRFGLGLDLELTNRVSAQAAQRVATTSGEKLLVSTVAPVAFWVAKEAAIKAFGNLAGISLHFGVVELLSINSHGSFTARWQSLEAMGYVFADSPIAIGLAKTMDSQQFQIERLEFDPDDAQ